MRKQFLFLILLVLACVSARADRVVLSRAQQVATTIALQQSGGSLRSVVTEPQLVYAAASDQVYTGLRAAYAEEAVDYYVFNLDGDKGFVIVSGEDRAWPVLGVSTAGGFDADRLPENFRGMLAKYQAEIAYAADNELEPSDRIRAEWARLEAGVTLRSSGSVELNTANWDQGDPYNRQTPIKQGVHAVTGCVATATAIVMKHHAYPTQAIPNQGVTSYDGQAVTYSPYQWDQMLHDYTWINGQPDFSEEQANQVAALMWNVGANVKMDYGSSLSSANTGEVVNALIDVFGYSASTRMLSKSWYTSEHWEEMLRAELDNGCPVIYNGQGNAGGHAFVCDGYSSEGTFRINWGWGSYCNGYYRLDALDPQGSTGQSIGTFNEDQGMVLVHHGDGVTERIKNLIYSNVTFPEGSLSPNQYVSIGIKLENFGNQATDPIFGLGIIDKKTKSVESTLRTTSFTNGLPLGYWGEPIFRFSFPTLVADQAVAFIWHERGESTWQLMEHADTAPLYFDYTGAVYESEDPVDIKHQISIVNLKHLSVTPELTEIGHGERLELKVQPESGYHLPDQLTVTMGGISLNDAYDAQTGQVAIASVTGDVLLAGEAVRNTYAIQLSLEHLTAVGPIEVNEGEPCSIRLVPDAGYWLPTEVTVSQDGSDLVNGTDYTYSEGVISIPSVTGDLSIRAAAIRITHAVTVTLSGLTLELPETVIDGEKLEGTFVVTDPENYRLPQSITVTMAGVVSPAFSYDKTTGSLSISQVKGAVSITASAELIPTFAVTTQLSHLTITGLNSTYKEGSTVTCQLVADENYRLPSAIRILTAGGETLPSSAYTYSQTDGMITILAISEALTICADAIDASHFEVSLSLEGVTSDLSNASYQAGSQVIIRFTANKGYNLPDRLTSVKMGGRELVASDYSYENGCFTLASITDDLEIIVVGTLQQYAVTHQLTYVEMTDETDPVVYGQPYSGRLVASTGYELPSKVRVTMDGIELNENGDYSYSEGMIRIQQVTGPLTIEATGIVKRYPVTAVLSHLISDVTIDQTVAHGESLTVTLRPAEGYKLPERVTVYMSGSLLSTGYTYVDGIIQIPNVQGSIYISATGVRYQVVVEDEHLTGEIPEINVKYEADEEIRVVLDDVDAKRLTIDGQANAVLVIQGSNQIEALNNQGTLTILPGSGTLRVGTLNNEGSLTDETGTIRKVEGPAAMEMTQPLSSQASYPSNGPATLSVQIQTVQDYTRVSFEWQVQQDDGTWETLWIDNGQLRAGGTSLSSSYTLTETVDGLYRCAVTVVSGNVSTTLMTFSQVRFTTPDPDPDPVPEPDPEPQPIMVYRITLPLVEGCTIDAYAPTLIEEGKHFSFRLRIHDGYNADNLVVKANGETLTADATGLYRIEDIHDNQIITISGIVRVEIPSASEAVQADVTSVWTSAGCIHLHVAVESMVIITDVNGRVVVRQQVAAGDHRFALPQGAYVVTVGSIVEKIMLR